MYYVLHSTYFKLYLCYVINQKQIKNKTMKKIINNQETPGLEFFKRILYSFQVLIVGIAIPVLFFLGISTKDQKKAKETEMSISANNSQLTAKSAVQLSMRGV